ncbi:AmmeMemoRadiSam system protein A [Halarcobacter bivalviorum]|uniref:AMMECR1 domain-containing protein n=1 Tax=Halarcobacter bivalviorum TaxID=663364 RepID=A0AAX2A6B7_9BACT|nr:AmmeMemoRadiSam system protein A [Halarcobacter bivalviorum]AXH12910.1 AmmeMemoRadiSam system protein A [Halarcobacter bivalviorum]RXK08969.1 AMMECR1 domain-containing protein [Halarcobacter bivalviorum]
MKIEDVLLKLASDAIESEFNDNISIDSSLKEQFSILKEQRATFVTLYLEKKLRGCVGSLNAYQSLFDDIISNARAAAFSDLRFNRLSFEEFINLEIEISILTPAEKLIYNDFEELKQKLIPNKHGVILELDGKKATFLPQVWEQLPNFEEFISHLCKKAGLNPNKLSGYPKIQIYEVQKIKKS